jgi:hypothetical protein
LPDLPASPQLDAESRARLLRLIDVGRNRNYDCSALERRLEQLVIPEPVLISDFRARRAVARAKAARNASDKLIADSKLLVAGSMLRLHHHQGRTDAA